MTEEEPGPWVPDLDDDLLFDETIEDDPELRELAEELAGDEATSIANLFLSLVDSASSALLDRPVSPRVKISPAGLLRGEIDVVKVEVPGFSISGLVVDRFIVRAERVRIVPGFPPRLKAGPIGFKAIVSQANVDRWTRTARLPARLRLTPEGIVMTTGVRGIRMGEIVTELDVAGAFIRLRPKRASLMGLPTTLVRFLRGYLPLPPLPKGAHLTEVLPADGEIGVGFRIENWDEPITPDIARHLQRLLRIPIPGL